MLNKIRSVCIDNKSVIVIVFEFFSGVLTMNSIIVDSSDESSSDDNDDIHPQLLVVAEYNASQDKSADLIDKSPTVPKISDVQSNMIVLFFSQISYLI